jgi:hypothetical protein
VARRTHEGEAMNEPLRPREVAVDLVREGRPWRYTRTGLVRAVMLRVPGRTRAAVANDVNELLRLGTLIEERRPEARGRKLRIGLARAHACTRARVPQGEEAGRKPVERPRERPRVRTW